MMLLGFEALASNNLVRRCGVYRGRRHFVLLPFANESGFVARLREGLELNGVNLHSIVSTMPTEARFTSIYQIRLG